MSRAWRARSFAITALASTLAVLLSCEDDPVRVSEIVLAVQTDVALPDSVDRINVEVSSNGTILSSNDHDVGAGKLLIPATLGVVGDAAAKPVRLRLVARKNNVVKMIREVTTTIPVNRIATLRMPIRWLCDDSAQETSPGNVTNTSCAAGQTCIGGDCYSSDVDSSQLPTYASGDGTLDSGCFDVVACLGGGSSVQPDTANCTIPKPASTGNLNIALKVKSDGVCSANGDPCFVILDRASPAGPLDGWREAGDRIQMPRAVCTRLASNRIQSIVTSTGCPTKTEALSVCGSWAGVPGGGGNPTNTDGGDGSITPSSGNPGTLIVNLQNVRIGVGTALEGGGCAPRVVGPRLVFCTARDAAAPNAGLRSLLVPDAADKTVAPIGDLKGDFLGPWFPNEGNVVLWLNGTDQFFNSASVTASSSTFVGKFDGNPNDISSRLSFGRAVDTQLVYGLHEGNGTVVAITRATGKRAKALNLGMETQQRTPTVLVSDNSPTGFAYIAAGANEPAVIERIAKTSTDAPASSLFASIPAHFIAEVAFEETSLYVLARDASKATASIYAVPIAPGAATGAPTLLQSNLGFASSLVIDGANVLWVEQTATQSKLVRSAKTGAGATTTLATEDASSTTILGVAVGDDRYYYVATNPLTNESSVKFVKK